MYPTTPTPAAGEPPAARTKIFISYRHQDHGGAAVAQLLHDQLRKPFGGRGVFKDGGSLSGGDDFREVIAGALASSRVALVVVGPEWLNASDARGRRLDDPEDVLRWEVATALRSTRARVIPVLAFGATMPEPDELPEDLQPLTRLHAERVRGGGDMEPDLSALVRRLKRILLRRRQAAAVILCAALLSVTAALAQFLSTADRVIEFRPDAGGAAAEARRETEPPRVSHSEQELILEGVTGEAGGTVLEYDGKRVANVRGNFPAAMVAPELNSWLGGWLQKNPGAKEDFADFAEITYSSGRPTEPDYKRACLTRVEVTAVEGAGFPTTLSFFQKEHDPMPTQYRDIEMQADRPLIARFTVRSAPGFEESYDYPFCPKRVNAGKSMAGREGDDSVSALTRAGTTLRFRFLPIDPRARNDDDVLKLGVSDAPPLFTPDLHPLRARAVKVRATKGGKLVYAAVSADEGEDLRLRDLFVGPDYIRPVVEGRAYVVKNGEFVSHGFFDAARFYSTATALMLAAAAGSLCCALYLFVRL